MRSWLSHQTRPRDQQRYQPPPGPPPDHAPPPAWEPAPEVSHTLGQYNEATDDDYERAEEYCNSHPPAPPKLLPSNVIERIRELGCAAWGLEHPATPRFIGQIEGGMQNKSSRNGGSWRVRSLKGCKDVCLMSDLPFMAGLYDIHGKRGVYYEIQVHGMDGVIAIGMACRPYPSWRMPGWNRLSAALHLDDLRKFFEDPDGGRDYAAGLAGISPGDTVGCGYEFANGALFFTHNGRRLPNAFTGIYMPRVAHDVYAAIGLDGANVVDVNFGANLFEWKEGNDWAWRLDGHVGRMSGSGPGQDERLPSYSEARFS
ncbi:hypothetical protein BC834DRAFT_901758 [Gloeopeniophorella convolvens]|nr:hypothetical protein BC834DRAFT_901758 [Gloeopeniophorella convolvens]